jgi:hypothetical protein
VANISQQDLMKQFDKIQNIGLSVEVLSLQAQLHSGLNQEQNCPKLSKIVQNIHA